MNFDLSRVRCPLWAAVALLFFSGCGAPEAYFSSSEATRSLMPKPQATVRQTVEDHFGEPGRLIAWLRMPLAFGGVSGTIVESSEPDDDGVVKSLKVDFTAPKVLVLYDKDLDGQLGLAELPADLQVALAAKSGAKTVFERIDKDENGLLSAAEIADERNAARVGNDAWIIEPVSAIAEMTPEEIATTRVYFPGISYTDGQSIPVTSFDTETGTIALSGGLGAPPTAGERVVLDFGQRLREGRRHYIHHCMHCHGVTGDGNGPTAQYLDPLPRDYRKGLFKFTSTDKDHPPQRDDLVRVVMDGIPGTYMPSFALLKSEEVESIVEYVRWLSMRGMFEQGFVDELIVDYSEESLEAEIEMARADKSQTKSAAEIRRDREEDWEEDVEDLPEWVDDIGDDVASFWQEADLHASVVLPKEPRTPDSLASRARGRVLYLQNNCNNCHGNTGEGNGPLTRQFDKDVKVKNRQPGLYDLWGKPIEPRNLTTGVYRGGRRPLDIYRRIHEGMPGTPMPNYQKLTDAQTWDIVNYVLSIPFEDQSTLMTTTPLSEPSTADAPAVSVVD